MSFSFLYLQFQSFGLPRKVALGIIYPPPLTSKQLYILQLLTPRSIIVIKIFIIKVNLLVYLFNIEHARQIKLQTSEQLEKESEIKLATKDDKPAPSAKSSEVDQQNNQDLQANSQSILSQYAPSIQSISKITHNSLAKNSPQSIQSGKQHSKVESSLQNGNQVQPEINLSKFKEASSANDDAFNEGSLKQTTQAVDHDGGELNTYSGQARGSPNSFNGLSPIQNQKQSQSSSRQQDLQEETSDIKGQLLQACLSKYNINHEWIPNHILQQIDVQLFECQLEQAIESKQLHLPTNSTEFNIYVESFLRNNKLQSDQIEIDDQSNKDKQNITNQLNKESIERANITAANQINGPDIKSPLFTHSENEHISANSQTDQFIADQGHQIIQQTVQQNETSEIQSQNTNYLPIKHQKDQMELKQPEQQLMDSNIADDEILQATQQITQKQLDQKLDESSKIESDRNKIADQINSTIINQKLESKRQSLQSFGSKQSLSGIKGENQQQSEAKNQLSTKVLQFKVNDVGIDDSIQNPFSNPMKDSHQKQIQNNTASSSLFKIQDNEQEMLVPQRKTSGQFYNQNNQNESSFNAANQEALSSAKGLMPANHNPIEPKKDESHQGEDHPCNCGDKEQNPDQQPVIKQEEEFIQELSYSALMKFIEANHPVHPITKKQFNLGDRIEVKQFFIKLLDPCNINKIVKKCIKCLKSYRKYALKGGCFSKNDDNQIKPEPADQNAKSLSISQQEIDQNEAEADEFTESSSFEDEGGFGGLDAAGANIGNGAGLYLQMMKTFTFLFFVLSLINIPIYMIYQSTTRNNNYMDIGFSYLSIGNIAQTNPACSFAPILPVEQSVPKFSINCIGQTEYLQSIDSYGLLYSHDIQFDKVVYGQEKCNQVINYVHPIFLSAEGRILKEQIHNEQIQVKSQKVMPPRQLLIEKNIDSHLNMTKYNLDSECNRFSRNLFRNGTNQRRKIDKYFQDNCQGKQSCEIDTSLFIDDLSSECIARNQEKFVNLNELLFVARCSRDYLEFFGTTFHKQMIGFIVILFDIASTLFSIHIFRRLLTISKEYSNTVDEHEITMSDFAVMCQQVHLDKYTQHITLIKMRVWLHFHEQLKMADDIKYGKLKNARKLEEELKKIRGDDSKVLDVQLSLATQPKIMQVKQMEATQVQINTIKSKLQAGEYMNAEFFQKQEELEDLNEQFEVQKEKYQYLCEEERKFIKSKTSLVNRSNRIDKIDYIFITFKHSATNDKAIEFCQQEPGASKFLRILFCLKDKILDSKQFRGREIKINRSVEPDEIQWQNLSFSGTGTLWKTITQFVSLGVFILLLVATMAVEGQKRSVEVDNPPIKCPDKIIKKEEAYSDEVNKKFTTGLMECYCLQQFKSEPWAVPNMKFTDVDPNGADENEYCKNWALGHFYRIFLIVISALLVIIFNSMTSKLFQQLSLRQRLHTTKETIQASFIQNLVVEFVNMGLMLLLVSLTNLHQIFMSSSSLQNNQASKKYTGLVPEWYSEVGSIINFTLIINCFFRNLLDLYFFLKIQYAQMSDRGFKSNLQKYPDDPDGDEPNTKKLVQEDLYSLYEGEEFQADKNLSRMMSTISVILFYSSAMPVVYIIGFVFFLLTYQLNKLMLFRYYKRTDSSLSSQLPMTCIGLLKYILFMKLLMGLATFTTPQIWITNTFPPDNDFVNWFKIDLQSYMTQFGFKNGQNEQGMQSIDILDYLQLIHQQWYFFFSVGLILLYLFQKVLINLMVVIMTAAGNAIIGCFTAIKRMIMRCIFFNQACLRNSANSIMQSCLKCLKKGQRIGVKKTDSELVGYQDQESRLVSDDALDREQVENLWQKHGIIGGASKETDDKMANQMQIELINEFKKEKESREQGFSENVIQEFDMENLRGFYLRAKREQLDFWAYFGINESTREYIIPPEGGNLLSSNILKNFEEHCARNKVLPSEVYQYDLLLQERIEEIEAVIDNHFQLIREVIEEEKLEKRERDIEKTFGKEDYRQKIERLIIEANFEKDPDRQYSNRNIYTYEKMLQQLCDHQVQLIRQHKDHQPSSDGICRMKGQTQSYFIFDAQNSKVARKIYYALEAEEDEYRKEHELDDFDFSSEDEHESQISSPMSEDVRSSKQAKKIYNRQ